MLYRKNSKYIIIVFREIEGDSIHIIEAKNITNGG